MKFTDLFIKRPVLAICLNLLILIGGIQAFRNLSVRQYPRNDNAIITVRTAYVGANADLVRGFVTTPIERAIASADGIDYLESSSQQGVSTITAHLRLNFDVNAALTQVQAKVAQVRNDLPPEAEAPSINAETQDSRFASMYLSFYSETLPQNQITDYLVRVVQPKLSSLPGIQKAEILGARNYAMRIWLKPDRMASLQISPGMVREALARRNVLSAVGTTKGSMIQTNLVTNTDLRSSEDFKSLVVKESEGTLVRLQDVADIELGAETYDEDVRFGGQAATFIGVWVLPNANALDVIARVKAELPAIEKNLPVGMQLNIPYDATDYIRDALSEVTKTLLETILIVVIVIYLFIGSLRSVLVPVIAIPLSLIGVGSLMILFGFTINLLTLLAIVLAVGLVVDDAIVMLENVERHVADGMAPREAAVKAARELAGPTIAMTITLAAVYTPIAFQGGLTGTLFKEFALTLAGAVFISGVVALTLSPMMSARLVRKHHSVSGFNARRESALANLQIWYRKRLTSSLNWRPFILTACAFLVLCLVPFYMFSMKELAPREDQGIVFGFVQGPPNGTVEQMSLYTEEAARIFQSVPEHFKTFQLTNTNSGFSGMLLKPWSMRSRTALEIEPEMWGKMSVLSGIRSIMTTPPPLPGGSDFSVEFVISSTAEPSEISGFANQLVGAAFESQKFMFADTDLKYDLPQSELLLDREKIASLGLDLRQIGDDLSVLTGGNYVNRFNLMGRSYKVIPQVKRVARLNPGQLLNAYVSGPKGDVVQLKTFASLRETTEPRQLNRFQQLNSAKIQGEVLPGMSIDAGLRALEEKAAEILPPGYTIDYAGESRQLRKEGSSLLTSLLFALVVIFLVLASQFESFRDPLIILAGSVPLALAGSLLFVFFGFTSLNIYSQVGLVTLVGLVAKNGILIVEFANKLKENGVPILEAIVEACATRLRPVLMTSVATVVGHFPLILASGAGAGARNSIGIVLVSGMIIGTSFTLFVLPSIYVLIARRSERGEYESSQLNETKADIIQAA